MVRFLLEWRAATFEVQSGGGGDELWSLVMILDLVTSISEVWAACLHK